MRMSERAPSQMSFDPKDVYLPRASAPTRRRDAFSLCQSGQHGKDRSASCLFLGGKALVLSSVVQAQDGEGFLLRGALCAETVLGSIPGFFLTGRQRDFTLGVLTHSELAESFSA